MIQTSRVQRTIECLRSPAGRARWIVLFRSALCVMTLARGLLSLPKMARARGAAVCKENAGALKEVSL